LNVKPALPVSPEVATKYKCFSLGDMSLEANFKRTCKDKSTKENSIIAKNNFLHWRDKQISQTFKGTT